MIFFTLLLTLLLSCENTNPNQQDKTKNQATNSPEVLYCSTDLGKTWTPFAEGIPKDATISEFMEDEKNTYATTDFHGIFIYNKEDNNWRSINKGLPENIDINAIEIIDNQLIIGSLHQGIFISNKEKINWQKSKSDISNTAIRALAKLENQLFAGTDNGVYISRDKGNTWEHHYGNMQVLGFATHENNIYAGVFNGAIGNTDKGNTWQYIYQEDALHDIAHDGAYLYAMTLGQGLLKTNNDGKTWEQANYGLSKKDFYTNEIVNIGNDLFTAQWIGIYHSNNYGEQWKLLSGGLPFETAFGTLRVTKLGLLAGVAIRG
ncbi:MAG: WD40/YVTN/BNR-like repeat-containing protein [Saprospiraceae bacterium]